MRVAQYQIYWYDSAVMMDFCKLVIHRIGWSCGLATALVILCLLPGHAWGGNLVLRIQAANPSDAERQVEVRSSLPARVTTDDIVDLAGLELGYDVKSDSYYVHGQLTLGPREIAVREVIINDIWVIDADELTRLEQRTSQLSSMLAATQFSSEARDVAAEVENQIADIVRLQNENRISLVTPVRHIQAYETNLQALRDVRQKVGHLENLTLAAGMSPGDTLIGMDRRAADPRRDAHLPTVYGEAVVQITVMNSSLTQERQIQIQRELPPEVGIEDVLDADGLSIRFDPQRKLTLVFADNLTIGPQETQTFDVRIRDKWNVNAPRIDFLQEKIDSIRLTTAGRAALDAVVNVLNEAESRLSAIAQETGPETFSSEYIAFYRRQADRLDEVEQTLNRLESALRPLDTRRGFAIPAPDKKTTWLVIYAILGFLALISLLFFFRWFVKS